MNTPSELEFTNVNETNATPQAQPTPPPTPTPTPVTPEAPAPEKKKRGRPKKGEAPKDTTFEKPKEASSIFDEIKKEVENNEQSINQLNNQSGTPGETPIHSAVKNVIDGYMLITLMDTFFPMLLKLAWKKAKKLKDKDIQLSKDQREHLEPIADEISQQLLSFLDPVSLFFIMAGAMYFQNTSEAIANVKE
jgi:hypothetical protein